MVQLVHKASHFRVPSVLLIFLMLAAALFSSCSKPEERPDLAPEVDRLKSELEETARKLNAAEKDLATKNDQAALASATLQAAKTEAAEKNVIVTQRDAQVAALKSEMATLTKSDAFIFADIRNLQQQGSTVVALDRYQKF